MSNANPLAVFDAYYEEATPPVVSGGHGPVPDGTYKATVETSEVRETNWGTWQWSMSLRINDGPQANRVLFKDQALDKEAGVAYAKKDIETLALVLPRFSDLMTRAGDAVGAIVEVAAKSTTQGDKVYQNVYLNELLTPSPACDVNDNPYA